MKIQTLSINGPSEKLQQKQWKHNKITYAHSPDEFDLNIIDLTVPKYLVTNNDDTLYYTNIIKYLRQTIDCSTKTKFIIILPPLETFVNQSDQYIPLHYNMNLLQDILSILDPYSDSISVEITTTTINNIDYNATYYFDNNLENTKYYSNGGKSVFIDHDEILITSLDFLSSEEKIDSLINILFPTTSDPCPEWIEKMCVLDDIELKNQLQTEISKREIINDNINNIYGKIDYNKKIKSILYTSGIELVRNVYEILQNITNYNLDDFIDEGREDFIIKKEIITFIGEIKGVSSNVNNTHISQLILHISGYLDDCQEQNHTVHTKGLLIINPQRGLPLSERRPINEKQIKMAEKNDILIITTDVLLSLFEKFKKGDMSSEECVLLFSSNTGVLNING